MVLALFLAIGTSFATDDYDNSWEKKAVPKKFLSKDCKKLAKKIWNEGMVPYYGNTILDIWKDYIFRYYVANAQKVKLSFFR